VPGLIGIALLAARKMRAPLGNDVHLEFVRFRI
jgi:hypothetical protein